jgi:ubiquitin-like protein Pup
MAERDTEGGQSRATRRTDEVEETTAEAQDAGTAAVKERHDKLAEDVDDILDEIDGVLESNAEEFVRGYVQKGGE